MPRLCRICSKRAVVVLEQSDIALCRVHQVRMEREKARLGPVLRLNPTADTFRSCHDIAAIETWRESQQDLVGGSIPTTTWSVPRRDYGPRELDEREREYDRGWERRQDLMPMPDARKRRE